MATTEQAHLTRNDWMGAARRALLRGGPAAVRVEPLAADLGVTKGSFYWHFVDRGELLEALLLEWEEELRGARNAIPRGQGLTALRALFEFLAPRVITSERGETPSDAAIFAWASNDPHVARRVSAAEARRLSLLQDVVGDLDLGEYLYLTYVGFLMRRRRIPGAASYFATFARLTERIVEALTTPDVRDRGPARRRRRH